LLREARRVDVCARAARSAMTPGNVSRRKRTFGCVPWDKFRMVYPCWRGGASTSGSACDELTLNPHPLQNQTPKGAPPKFVLGLLRLSHPPGQRNTGQPVLEVPRIACCVRAGDAGDRVSVAVIANCREVKIKGNSVGHPPDRPAVRARIQYPSPFRCF